jgi:hypothetical protein
MYRLVQHLGLPGRASLTEGLSALPAKLLLVGLTHGVQLMPESGSFETLMMANRMIATAYSRSQPISHSDKPVLHLLSLFCPRCRLSNCYQRLH